MGRTKGAKNNDINALSHYAKLPTEDRIKFLANLIVDRINSDQVAGGKIIKNAKVESGARPRLFA